MKSEGSRPPKVGVDGEGQIRQGPRRGLDPVEHGVPRREHLLHGRIPIDLANIVEDERAAE